MKRSEMEIKIQEKLRKQKHLFDTFQKNPDKMPFDCLIGNLCGRILTEIEEVGMLPPESYIQFNLSHGGYEIVPNWVSEND